MNKLVINCETGQSEYVAMSAEEITARENETYAVDVEPTEQRFALPLAAPVITAGEYIEAPEYFVLSPKPQDTKDKALAKAKEIAGMTRKGLAEILLNLLVVIDEQEREIKNLKDKIK